MLYCIKNLVNKPSDFTTLRPLTDVKEFVIFLFASESSFDLTCFGRSPFPPWATTISMQHILQYEYVSPFLEVIKHENSCLCSSMNLWLYFPLFYGVAILNNTCNTFSLLETKKPEICLLKRLNVTKRSLVFKASLHSKNKYKLVTAQHMKYFWILNRSEFYNNILFSKSEGGFPIENLG